MLTRLELLREKLRDNNLEDNLALWEEFSSGEIVSDNDLEKDNQQSGLLYGSFLEYPPLPSTPPVNIEPEESFALRRKFAILKLRDMYKRQFFRLHDSLRTQQKRFLLSRQKLLRSETPIHNESATGTLDLKGLNDYGPVRNLFENINQYCRDGNPGISQNLQTIQPLNISEKRKTDNVNCQHDRCETKTIALSSYCFTRKATQQFTIILTREKQT